MTKKILITGGLGFIGYHLCEHLLRRDPRLDIVVVDNLSSTRLDYSSLTDRVRIVIDDLRDFAASDAAAFDEIYHLASPVGSVGILAANGRIALDILELADCAARLAAVAGARLLYVSSSEVYGRDGSQTEDAEQMVPIRRGARMEYAVGKLAAEHALLNQHSSGRFELRIVRPFNVIGNWQSAGIGFVVPRFFEAALAGRPLQVYGDGSQRRSFCHVEDLVAGIEAVQRHGHDGAVYNVGHPANVTTIGELARRVVEMASSASTIEFVDPVSLHGPHYIEAFQKIPCIDRVRSHTGWAPGIGLEPALRSILAHHVGLRGMRTCQREVPGAGEGCPTMRRQAAAAA
jgi:nucleoside-diphosphate-sugar epimerase